MSDQLHEMRRLAARHAGGGRAETAIPRVILMTTTETTAFSPGICQPALCLVLQGAKEVMIGERLLRYDTSGYFIVSLELPATARIVEANRAAPYIAVALGLDRDALAALLPEVPAPAAGDDIAGFGVSPVTAELRDAWVRLLRLLETPRDIPVLAPLIEREILYRLLQGPRGHVLRQIASADGRLAQVRQAITWLRANFDRPIRIEALAERAGMSAASFHRHFKAATAMSPLQYQKHLRLQQARRLLIANQDAARAAYAVGYESASQLSREYARLFGAPPARDALRLQRAGETAGVA